MSDSRTLERLVVGHYVASTTPTGKAEIISRRQDGRLLIVELVAWPSGHRSLRVSLGLDRLNISGAEAALLGTALLARAEDAE